MPAPWEAWGEQGQFRDGHVRLDHQHLGAVLGDAATLVLAADHEAGDVVHEQQRDAVAIAELHELRGLVGRLAEQHAVVTEDPDLVAEDEGAAGDQGRSVAGLELVEHAAVDDAGDDFAHVELLLDVVGDDPVQLGRVVVRRLGHTHVEVASVRRRPHADDVARQREGLAFGVHGVVGRPGDGGVHVRATEFLGADLLAGGGLHKRRGLRERRRPCRGP